MKYIVVLICMLFIGAVLPVSGTVLMERTSKPTFTGNTLYVGGSGPGNYSTIQEAIDDSEDGDTVFVYDDSSPYYENLIVDKSIELIGENKQTTIIDGGLDEDVIWVRDIDGVTINSFTIRNGEHGLYFLESYNNVITNNIIHDHHFPGIIFLVSGRNTITNNIVTNTSTGIYFFKTIDSIISNNTIESNNHSLYIKTLSNNNTFSNNSIGWSSYTGVFIYDRCEKNVFFENNIKYSLEILETCTENLFYHNNFIEEWGHACDKGSNNWDNGKEGNYWHFYEGYDLFPRDGIGDTPYDIPGGDNQDNYPLMKPWPNTKNRAFNINSFLFRFLDGFPLLEKILALSGLGAFGIPIEKSVANVSEPKPELNVEVKGGFGITLTIENIGDADATEVFSHVMSIGITIPPGSMAYSKQSGTIAPGESVTVRYIRNFGFGLGFFGDSPYINVHAGCDEGVGVDFTVNASIIFIFILLR